MAGAKTVKPKNVGGKVAGSFFDKVNKLLFGKSTAASKRAGASAANSLINMHKKKK